MDRKEVLDRLKANSEISVLIIGAGIERDWHIS